MRLKLELYLTAKQFSRLLQMCGREGLRVKFVEISDVNFACQIGAVNDAIGGKFGDDLTAQATGWPRRFGVGDDHYSGNFWLVFDGYGCADSDAFGTNCRAVRSVFHVATDINLAAGTQKGRADEKATIRRISALAHRFSGIVKRFDLGRFQFRDIHIG